MASNGRPRPGIDDLLAHWLAAGSPVTHAASAVGCGASTVHRRLKDPAFKAKVAEIRSRMVSDAVGRLSESMVAAADALRELLHSANEGIKLAAARTILETGSRMRDAIEIEARLRLLEGGSDDQTPRSSRSA